MQCKTDCEFLTTHNVGNEGLFRGETALFMRFLFVLRALLGRVFTGPETGLGFHRDINTRGMRVASDSQKRLGALLS